MTVDFNALPVPMPRFKPSPEEMRPLAQARPRPKPGVMEPITDAAPADVALTAASGVALPRPKPGSELAAAAPTAAAPVEAPATQAVQAAAQPARPPAAPVTIVGTPVTDDTLPVEITGVAVDPNASRTPVDPTAGFSILSRVRFSKEGSSLSPQAHSALDALAARLLSSRERVKLAAFSGKIGGDSSQARRLSLTRALAIRTYLVSKGVPVERVDVLAFGGPPQGVTDRVDVLVRGI
ncbi:MAG: OmpA family protein [Alphaproteobacteria bacterium]|nr:OmpA family protein [Alphaproteobacteria bacterium]